MYCWEKYCHWCPPKTFPFFQIFTPHFLPTSEAAIEVLFPRGFSWGFGYFRNLSSSKTFPFHDHFYFKKHQKLPSTRFSGKSGWGAGSCFKQFVSLLAGTQWAEFTAFLSHLVKTLKRLPELFQKVARRI